jgi:hypothetical protein
MTTVAVLAAGTNSPYMLRAFRVEGEAPLLRDRAVVAAEAEALLSRQGALGVRLASRPEQLARGVSRDVTVDARRHPVRGDVVRRVRHVFVLAEDRRAAAPDGKDDNGQEHPEGQTAHERYHCRLA